MYVTTQEIDLVPNCVARLRAPFFVLEKMFGTPVPNDEGFSTCWRVRQVADARLGFRIHDEARSAEGFAVESFRRLPYYDWFVEGAERQSLTEFCQWLSLEVIRALGEKPPGRRLTENARNRMNQLIRQGLPPEAALARCAEWELTPSTGEQFAWPIRNTCGISDMEKAAAPQKKGTRQRPPATAKKKPPRPRSASQAAAGKTPPARKKTAGRKK